MTTSTDYKAGQRAFGAWLRERGIILKKIDYAGIASDDGWNQASDDGWDHHAYTLHVGSVKMPRKDDYRYSAAAPTTFAFPYKMGLAHDNQPKLTDLMGSLFTDARCVLNRSFDEFADDLGYDSDSRKAEQMYNDIRTNNDRLKALFSVTDLDGLLNEAVPLMEAAGL